MKWPSNSLMIFLFLALLSVSHGDDTCSPGQKCSADHLTLILPDTHIPADSIFADNRIYKSRTDVWVDNTNSLFKEWIGIAQPELKEAVGKPKTEILKHLNAKYSDFLVKDKSQLPADYKYFGSEENLEETFALFLRTNVFYASTLTATKEKGKGIRFFIKTSGSDSWYAKLVAATADKYLRVDMEFDENFNVVSFSAYKLNAGAVVPQPDVTKSVAIKSLILLINWYAQAVHTQLHNFQHLLVTGLMHAADVSVAMNAFVAPYVPNIRDKYYAVSTNFVPGGTMVEGVFKSDRLKVLEILRQLVASWGQLLSAEAFISEWALKNINSIDAKAVARLGLLSELSQQIKLVKPYADEITRYFKSNPRYALSDVNKRLKWYFANTGKGFNSIPDLKVWIELMCATGLIHGGTLSYSRFMVTPSAMYGINPTDTFSPEDARYWLVITPSIVGVTHGRNVFNHEIFKNSTREYDPHLVDILAKHADKSAEVKQETYEKFLASGKLNEFGWVLSEYFPDGYDGKQLTLTTYF